MERLINIPKQILEEAFEIESPPLKDVKMLQSIHNPLGVRRRSTLLSLNLHQEPPQLIHAHHAALRVLLEDLLHVGRRLRRRKPEAALEAEAHPVGLFAGHCCGWRIE